MDAILHMFVSKKDDPMRLKDGSRTNSGKNSKDRQPQKPAAAERPLADYLCFAIYSANLAYGRAYKQGLQKLGLTYPQWIAIVALGEYSPCAEPGAAAVTFLPKMTEDGEPGGVNWITRQSSPAKSASNLQPRSL